MSCDFISFGGFVPWKRCAESGRTVRPDHADHALVPDVVYSHPPALHIGDSPAAGSVRVPVNVPVGVIVPRSSIPDPLPLPALKMRSADPSLSATAPLRGNTTAVGGFCQLLVEVLIVPSASTSKCAVRSDPSASNPPVQASVDVFRTVNDQSPVAWVCVTAPPPVTPMPKRSGSVLVSQAAVRTSRVRARAIGRT